MLFKNNKHWNGLHRSGGKMTADMKKLRSALKMLVDESIPIRERLECLRPRKGRPMVDGLAKSVSTAILQVVHPDKYGVYNNVSAAGLEALNLWPDVRKSATLADRYEAVNSVLLELAEELDIDLWTLDMLWWRVTDRGKPQFEDHERQATLSADEQQLASVESLESTFGLERHLHEFLVDNWDATTLGNEWQLYEEDGELAGSEYPTGEVGRIDLLAHHRTEKRWLVVELKRGQTSDSTVGQVLRYVNWVRRKLAKPGEAVEGLIVCQRVDRNLQYAISDLAHISCMTYEVSFTLHDSPELD